MLEKLFYGVAGYTVIGMVGWTLTGMEPAFIRQCIFITIFIGTILFKETEEY